MYVFGQISFTFLWNETTRQGYYLACIFLKKASNLLKNLNKHMVETVLCHAM